MSGCLVHSLGGGCASGWLLAHGCWPPRPCDCDIFFPDTPPQKFDSTHRYKLTHLIKTNTASIDAQTSISLEKGEKRKRERERSSNTSPRACLTQSSYTSPLSWTDRHLHPDSMEARARSTDSPGPPTKPKKRQSLHGIYCEGPQPSPPPTIPPPPLDAHRFPICKRTGIIERSDQNSSQLVLSAHF